MAYSTPAGLAGAGMGAAFNTSGVADMSGSSSTNGRRVIGVLLVLVAAALGLGQEWALRRDLNYAEAVGPRVDAYGDSAMRASIAFHEANAHAAGRARWSPLGHGTIGVVGVLVGVAILATTGRRRRRDVEN